MRRMAVDFPTEQPRFTAKAPGAATGGNMNSRTLAPGSCAMKSYLLQALCFSLSSLK